MAMVTEAPEDLPEANPDALKDLNTPPPPAEIRLGSTVLMTLESPPSAGSFITISARLYIKHAGFDQNTPDSEIVHVRQAQIREAWIAGQTPPAPKKTKAEENAEAEAEAAANQPPLLDEDGVVDPDAAGIDTDPETDEDLGRPPFSDADPR